MRGKATKQYVYIVVMTLGGPVFVTSFGEGKTAYWKKDKAPKEIGDVRVARDIALGLTVNGSTAYAVVSAYEILNQPYHYANGGFEWKWNEEENK